MPATFFTIGEELEDGPSAMAIAELARLGHEIATHGWTGDRYLTSRPVATIREEVGRAAERLETLIGRRPAGFRATGEDLSASLLGVLEDEAFLYDASIHPSLPMWLGRAALRRAHLADATASPTSPAALFAPRDPYRPHPRDPFRRGSSKLIELPVATIPVSRLPFTGTFLVSIPKRATAALYRALRLRNFVAIELQGHDILDETDGASLPLVQRRRDLRIPVAVKRQRISELLDWLREDFEVVTLEEAAARLAPVLR